jgi:hypothetical protein
MVRIAVSPPLPLRRSAPAFRSIGRIAYEPDIDQKGARRHARAERALLRHHFPVVETEGACTMRAVVAALVGVLGVGSAPSRAQPLYCSVWAGANMKRRIKTFLAGGVLALALFGVARAGPFEDAQEADQNGDYATELRILRPLAEQGNALAQLGLGLMYAKGQGVPQDYAQAFVWYRKAADQGDADAQTIVGLMYRPGQGVSQDYERALIWYRKAADQGDGRAQFALGVM